MLYIFDKDDILLEIIEDFEDDEMNRELNSDWTYNFKIDINTSKNIKKPNKVGFFDDDEFYLFLIDEVNDTIFSEDIKSVYCINDMYSINGHIIEDKRCVDYSINKALEKALEGTGYIVGELDTFDINTVSFYYISSLAALNKIVKVYNAEYMPRVEYNKDTNKIEKYIDVKVKIGQDTGLRFTYDTNIEEIKRNEASYNHYTVLYGRGASLQMTDDEGQETGGYTRLIDFSDVEWSKSNGNPCDKPLGQKYVEDIEAIEKYGRIEGIYENKDIESTSELLQATYEALQETKEINVSYEVSVQDLSNIEGFEHYKYTLGDRIIILDDDYDINLESRIIKETLSLKNKTKVVTLGYIFPSMSSNNASNIVSGDEEKENDEDKFSDEDFPNTLPDPPVLSIDREGFASISLSWTFENKPYYVYELYASKLENFNPTENHLIWRGHGSAFLHEVNFHETWYYRARVINSHGQYTDFSNQVSATTYKIDDATEIFEKAAIKEALIESLNADKINAGKVKGTYIDARNLNIIDGNGNTTMSVSSEGIVKLIQGLIDISDEGIRISLVDSEDNIVGYVIYDGQGVQIFTNNDEPISSFHREGAYTGTLVTDKLVCSPVVQIADKNGCSRDWYIASTSTGDGTGKDENNKANSLKDVLRNIKSYGYKFNNKITIHIENDCILNEDIVIQDFMGTVFSIELAENVVINCSKFIIEDMLCRIFIEYKSQNRLVAGNITQADYDKYPILNSENDSSCISIANTNYIEVTGIRIRGRESAYGISTFAGSNLQIDDCDFSGVSQCVCASGQSKVSLGWSSGRVEQLATLYGGSIFTSSRRIPKYTGDTMVEANENTIFIENTNGYTQFDTLYNTSSSTGGASAGSGTNLTDNFIIDKVNLYTMVEGEGKQTTARKGYTGQGKYKNLKAHRGYIKLPTSDIKTVLSQKKSYVIKLRMTRLDTEHGYNSKTPHPIIRAVDGSNGSTEYWDSGINFDRGETQTIILPSTIVNAIENGATTLELWADTDQEKQYSFYSDVSIIVEGENSVIGDEDKPSDAVGTGETAYNATGTTTANLNVRKGAGSSYSIITTLPQGTTVTIVAKDDASSWYKISYNGAYGYVSNKYVTITSEGTTIDTSTIQDFPYADDLVETATTYWRACDNEYTSSQSWSQGLTYRSSATPLSGSCEAEQDVANSLWKTVTRSGQTRHYKAIDCSTLSGMATKGYKYEEGPYANKTKFTAFRKDRLQKNNDVVWSFNMIRADGTFAREAAAQAEYFDRIGAGIVYYRNVDTGETYGDIGTADNNYEPIHKGDLVFYAKKVDGNWKQPDRHMKISHVAICYGNNSSGNKAVIESTNGTMTKNHIFDDGTTINAGVRIVSIAGQYGYADDIVMVVRLQPIHYNS